MMVGYKDGTADRPNICGDNNRRCFGMEETVRLRAGIFSIGTREGNDQAQHRSKQPVCESNSIKDSSPDKAGRAHRHSTHHPDGVMVDDCGAQDRSRNQPDAVPIEDGGLQDLLNEEYRRSTRTHMASPRLWRW